MVVDLEVNDPFFHEMNQTLGETHFNGLFCKGCKYFTTQRCNSEAGRLCCLAWTVLSSQLCARGSPIQAIVQPIDCSIGCAGGFRRFSTSFNGEGGLTELDAGRTNVDDVICNTETRT